MVGALVSFEANQKIKSHGRTSPLAPCPLAECLGNSSLCCSGKSSLCGIFDDSDRDLLRRLFVTNHYTKKAIVVHEQRLQNGIQIVSDGVLRLWKTSLDGDRRVIGFAIPGDVVGLSVEGRSAYGADALGCVSTYYLSTRAFDELIWVAPYLADRFNDIMCATLSKTYDHLMLLSHYPALRRLAIFLLEMRNRWRQCNGADVLVHLPMSRQDIADYLGLTIETVSRTITLLTQQKCIIVVPSGIRILELGKLEAVALDNYDEREERANLKNRNL